MIYFSLLAELEEAKHESIPVLRCQRSTGVFTFLDVSLARLTNGTLLSWNSCWVLKLCS